MQPAPAFGITVVIAVSAKTGAWLWQRATRNAGMVDAVWAWTLAMIALFYAAVGSAPPATRTQLALMGALWGMRLGVYLFIRNHGKPEDWRYASFRAQWGAGADRKMFWFFQFQNVFTLLLSASAFLTVAYRPGNAPPAACWAAVALWLVSVLGETLADRQMKHFRANPANKGRVCRDGLWNWSRHPNYFFECVHWTAYISLAWGAPMMWASFAAPLVMAWLLLRLSGVPMLEKEMIARKPGYAE
ncbi:MAG TPA: DUF1295 domain-containing protein, partial [Nevskiaceae bacterium]|nr:DUF1295 domain-containing protein [Nevskiaceae bacterium]